MFSSIVVVNRNPNIYIFIYWHGIFWQNATASYLFIYRFTIGKIYSELLSLFFHSVSFLLLLVKHQHLAADFDL